MGIKMTAGGIDWAHYAKRAAAMTDAELYYARVDCAETAKLWDRAPYEHERAKAGHYRDEGSVYATETRRRAVATAKAAERRSALGTMEDVV